MGKGYHRMTFEDRKQIEKMRKQGMAQRAIGAAIHKSCGAICTEIKHGTLNGAYNAQYAQERSKQKQCERGSKAVLSDPMLAEHVAGLILEARLTVLQVVKRLAEERHLFREVPGSVNSIYRAIDAGLIPGVTRDDLRPDTTTVFSGGLIRIANSVKEQMGIKDGDILRFEVQGKRLVFFKEEEA